MFMNSFHRNTNAVPSSVLSTVELVGLKTALLLMLDLYSCQQIRKDSLISNLNSPENFNPWQSRLWMKLIGFLFLFWYLWITAARGYEGGKAGDHRCDRWDMKPLTTSSERQPVKAVMVWSTIRSTVASLRESQRQPRSRSCLWICVPVLSICLSCDQHFRPQHVNTL